ncbi:interferon regulatory factor 4-like [Pelobates cultripes]|uniref:Interferon regulatory factor 4-like n=1 Tax=Pelobates cultripes TaxID=61616 RepID=A0AAD1WG21_PELCU|nr:interferon regulatory factor 4-like [Pelobates cultripes]CAH2303028.1 interferon regulatory factor 4-like [Pelobates cultripes]
MSHTGTQQLRLKEWLVLQINSGRYPGLRWENEDRTLFRIPWKHASKQDYKAQQDAALFKAWAIYKGKYREGSEKDDPSVWKTRLRCALNKSPDFQEVQENSQMELPEPYKLYRIVSETRERSENVCTEIHESSQKENLEIPPTQDSIQVRYSCCSWVTLCPCLLNLIIVTLLRLANRGVQARLRCRIPTKSRE